MPKGTEGALFPEPDIVSFGKHKFRREKSLPADTLSFLFIFIQTEFLLSGFRG